MLDEKEAESIFRESKIGFLSVDGESGYPYGVPVNFAYMNGKIAFHCACEGRKAEAMKRNSKVAFCAVSHMETVPEEFTTIYKSAMASGKVRLLKEGDEFEQAMKAIGDKYCSGLSSEYDRYLDSCRGKFYAGVIDIECISAKGRKNL